MAIGRALNSFAFVLVSAAFVASFANGKAAADIHVRVPVQISAKRDFTFDQTASKLILVKENGSSKPVVKVEAGTAPARLGVFLDLPDKSMEEIEIILKGLARLFGSEKSDTRILLFSHEHHRKVLRDTYFGFRAGQLKWSTCSLRAGEFNSLACVLEFLHFRLLGVEVDTLSHVPVREVLILTDGGIGKNFGEEVSDVTALLKGRRIPLNVVQYGLAPLARMSDLLRIATFTGGHMLMDAGNIDEVSSKLRENYSRRAIVTYKTDDLARDKLRKIQISLLDSTLASMESEVDSAIDQSGFGLSYPEQLCLSLLCTDNSDDQGMWISQVFSGIKLFPQYPITIPRHEQSYRQEWGLGTFAEPQDFEDCQLRRSSSARSDLVSLHPNDTLFIKRLFAQFEGGTSPRVPSNYLLGVKLSQAGSTDLVFQCEGRGAPNPAMVGRLLQVLGQVLYPQKPEPAGFSAPEVNEAPYDKRVLIKSER